MMNAFVIFYEMPRLVEMLDDVVEPAVRVNRHADAVESLRF